MKGDRHDSKYLGPERWINDVAISGIGECQGRKGFGKRKGKKPEVTFPVLSVRCMSSGYPDGDVELVGGC